MVRGAGSDHRAGALDLKPIVSYVMKEQKIHDDVFNPAETDLQYAQRRASELFATPCSALVEWPTDEGIWMANFESVGWFPIRTMYLRDDLPTREEMAGEADGELMPPRKVLAVVAQFPESATSWPYTFQKCHPAKEWRRPTDDEMEKARKFYGVDDQQPKREEPMKKLTDEQIAEICHETNRAYCRAIGDLTQVPWAEAPAWQRDSAVNGVRFHLHNPEATESASHEQWLDQKRREGWQYGATKDVEKKLHPCFIPFAGLPLEQQLKDRLFKGVVDAVRDLAEGAALLVAGYEMDWADAEEHFNEVRKQYQDLEGKPGVNTTIALRAVFDPLARRFNSGERSPELYREMLEVQ